MKTRSMIMIGAVVTAILLVVSIGVEGVGLYENQRINSYVSEAVEDVFAHWDEKALLNRAGPELSSLENRKMIDQAFLEGAQLGKLTNYTLDRSAIHSRVAFTTSGLVVVAECPVHAVFEHGSVDIMLTIKDDKTAGWRIMGFEITPG